MRRFDKSVDSDRRQRGGVTVFTAVLVLIVLTLMMFYAARVGLFEQRISSNDVRQKTAFHAAEAAVDETMEYMLANSAQVISSEVDVFPDGAGGFTRDGWFASGRWVQCTTTDIASATHPCGGDTPMKPGSYYYDDPTTTSGVDSLPLRTDAFAADVTARVTANICFISLAAPAAGTCATPPTGSDEANDAYMIITVMGYGFSDCTDTTNVGSCKGKAEIARPVANYKNLSGSPVVPLTTKTTFPPTGTAEVVPNPNAGGVGVPVSVWSNNNTSCGTGVAVTGSGNWATCELQEWYGTDTRPAGTACNQNNCSCTVDEAISYTSAQTTYQGIDIVADPAFPCDLFQFYFGVPRAQYQIIKNSATVLTDCTSLDEFSSGLYWISGSDCTINANSVIGSPRTPVIIISAATLTKINGGAKIFGVLYVFDGEDANATLDAKGTNTIYGAAIVDATMGQYQGTFQVVYNKGVLANAQGANGLGAVNGGWRDFGLPDVAW